MTQVRRLAARGRSRVLPVMPRFSLCSVYHTAIFVIQAEGLDLWMMTFASRLRWSRSTARDVEHSLIRHSRRLAYRHASSLRLRTCNMNSTATERQLYRGPVRNFTLFIDYSGTLYVLNVAIILCGSLKQHVDGSRPRCSRRIVSSPYASDIMGRRPLANPPLVSKYS